MARTVLQDVDRVLASAWYRAWALVHRTDAGKIKLERAGSRRPISQDSWARCFIESIRVALAVEPVPLPPPPPPPPPPPAYKKVAPRVAYKENGSDARYCCVNQPGVVWSENHPDGPCYVDEAPARYDRDGLCLGGRTTDGTFGLTVGAKSMDGRAPCELPTVGDPALNTGSWAI